MRERWQGRLAEPDSSKERRFRAVAEAVANLVLVVGPSRVTVSAVARRAGVSRSWIYKYFGNDPRALVTHTVQLYAEAFSDLHRSRSAPTLAEWRANIAAGTRDALRDAVAAPWCVRLYFRHRHAQDGIADTLREMERRYLQAFVADLPAPLQRADAAQFAEVFTAARMGAYHAWLDPSTRARISESAMIREILRPLDAWVAGGP